MVRFRWRRYQPEGNGAWLPPRHLGGSYWTLELVQGSWSWLASVVAKLCFLLSNILLHLGSLLKKRLVNAVSEFQRHLESWKDFSRKQASNASEWKKMVDDFENGESDFNPYELPVQGK